MLSSLIASVITATMLGGAILTIHAAFKPPRREGHYFGDCTDEMFEAMREVDAMGLGGEPLLSARLPPREQSLMFPPPPQALENAYPVRFDRPVWVVRQNDRMVTLPNGKKVPEEYFRDPDGVMVEREWEN